MPTAAPIRHCLAPTKLTTGNYELVFFVGDYFGERRFLDRVPVRFIISDADGEVSCPAARFSVGLQHVSRQLNERD